MRRPRKHSLKFDDELIRRFVATFAQLDELGCLPSAPPPPELFAGMDADGSVCWRPAVIATPREQLHELYRRVPGPFPALYEELVLNYRWLEVDLQTARLLANPPGPTLDGLADEMLGDPVLINTLLPAGFIPFGKATDLCYDPMCFDLDSRQGDDCPIVQLEHESILCHDKIGASWQRFPSFRDLMCETIDLAQSKHD
jgi:hypothetical protein